ncbi:Galactoside 2-alpha-L-fucosyltransferase 2 [Chelonia mydas]|uniref:L-Fucosyltransferase n=1 Tax=Chelonia mydas TaxID=8469 RepID=M7BYC7_CHEMY|nr:Galactoside 2-alpha-L-fucosyltransferase 2 [Chelonia mydas]
MWGTRPPAPSQAAPLQNSSPLYQFDGQVRLRHLYTANTHTQLYLEITPQGEVRGAPDQTPYSLMEIKAVKPGVIRMQGMKTLLFLCMDPSGHLHGASSYSEACNFREKVQRDGYNLYFSETRNIPEEANRYLAGLRGQRRNVTYVGVHVRRGDYVQVMGERWKGWVADKAYLEKAMGYFRAKYQEPVFVVTSNGMEWCRENIDASWGDVYFSGDGKESSPGRDFALLAHCNHTIMTIGTFGIWAGYLAGGETIYLANYTLPDSPFLEIFKPAAAFLPEWIGIDADLSPLRSGTPG